ncbi:MAG: J domain-containing protein [Cyclobacteriaceae bacterium]
MKPALAGFAITSRCGRQDDMENYYQLLGVSQQATQLEIKRSFRRLAVLYHPDKNNTVESEERFKKINTAYAILSDPSQRAQYDVSLAHPYNQLLSTKPTHRDPAYRRRPPMYRREASQSPQELMAEYLPRFRWACWAGLALCLFLALDYGLPFNNHTESIAEINRIYRTGRGGGMIYDHDELVTKSGARIYLYDEDILHFKKVREVDIQQTSLFGKIVSASTPDGNYKTRVAAIYASLIFVPIVLFVASLLGVTIRKGVEFPFNLTIVSFVFLIIVSYLLIR